MLKISLQPPLSTCHQDQCSWFAIDLSLFTPSILCHNDFMKSLSTATKSLRIFRKLSRRSTVTRLWWEHSCKRLSKRQRRGNRRRPTKGAPVQRLSLPPKWRMTGRKLTQAYGVTTKPVHPRFTRIWSSPRSQQGDHTNRRKRIWRRSEFRHARRS